MELAREQFKREPAFIELDQTRGQIVFIGDTHGDVETSREIFDKFPTDRHTLVFLGDYVDREKPYIDSIYNILFLLHMKNVKPERVFLLKGDHEQAPYWPHPDFVQGLLAFLTKNGAFDRTEAILKEPIMRVLELLKKNPGRLPAYKDLLQKFRAVFDEMPVMVRTRNGIVAAHAGLPQLINNRELTRLNGLSQEEYDVLESLGHPAFIRIMTWRPDRIKEFLALKVRSKDPRDSGMLREFKDLYLSEDKRKYVLDDNTIERLQALGMAGIQKIQRLDKARLGAVYAAGPRELERLQVAKLEELRRLIKGDSRINDMVWRYIKGPGVPLTEAELDVFLKLTDSEVLVRGHDSDFIVWGYYDKYDNKCITVHTTRDDRYRSIAIADLAKDVKTTGPEQSRNPKFVRL